MLLVLSCMSIDRAIEKLLYPAALKLLMNFVGFSTGGSIAFSFLFLVLPLSLPLLVEGPEDCLSAFRLLSLDVDFFDQPKRFL